MSVRKPHNHTLEEVMVALWEIALADGNVAQAARQLEAKGNPVPRPTLDLWKRRHADRYAEIEKQAAGLLSRRIARQVGHRITEGLTAGVA